MQENDANSEFKEVKSDIGFLKDNEAPQDFSKLKDQIKEKKPKEVSGEINVSENLKDDENKKVKITFKDESFVSDIVDQKTADAPTDDSELEVLTKKETRPLDEIRQEIIEEEKKAQEKFSADDYDMISEFIIDAIDWSGSSLLMFMAKDTTDTPYVLGVQKKQRLQKQLTRILIKMEVKFSFTTLFVISLILAYVTPVKKALESRKIIKEGEKKISEYKDNKVKESKKETSLKKTVDKLEKTTDDDFLKSLDNELIQNEDLPLLTPKEISEVLPENLTIDTKGKVVKRRKRGGARK
jgi:hypothetical protein